jgi:septum formation protein
MGTRLLLASASPRRRQLLAELGFVFEVVSPAVEEHEDPAMDPREMVARNAAAKAEWVARCHPGAVVLGADTTVFLDGQALNKPVDTSDARRMLRALSGRTHTVHTGVAVRARGGEWREDGAAESAVTFKALDERTIDAYLERVHVLDKAGAYAIQEHGDLIVAGFSGELSTIIGLPMTLAAAMLERAGVAREGAA